MIMQIKIQKGAKMKPTLIFFVSMIISSSFLFAQDGVLDGTFNSTGKVTTSFGSAYDGGKDIAMQSDGKIVVVGVYPHGTDDDFAVARYLSDGTLDAGFGTSGKVTTSIGANRDAAYSVAIQTDGKIVVAGLSSDGTYNHIAVVRYTSAGALDNTFDTDGIVTTVVGSSDNPAYSVALQSDGKIVVAGYAHIGLTDDFAVVRYNGDGSLDTGFDTDGIVTTAIGAASDVANSVAIQTDGKIVLAGYVGNGGTANDFAVVRYNSDGSLDNTFDTDGIVTTAIGSGSATDVGYDVAIQSEGKIVVAGYARIGITDDFAVVRYNSDGTLDTGFDSDGKVTTDFSSGNDWGYSLALQLDGKIVVCGFGNISGNKIATVRYNINGTLDTGFDTDGKVTTAVGSNGDYGNSVALQSDGKIVVAGISYVSGSDADFAVVRYSGSSGPLPVELISFTASISSSSIELNWKTATELNNYGFEIERALASLGMAWQKIGFVQGNGNSNSPKEYSFTDHAATSGSYSYRLKQIDNDGTFNYSSDIEVTVGQIPNDYSLNQNYPNPFNPSTTIAYDIPKTSLVRISVYDILGKEIKLLVNEEKNPGHYEIIFDAKELAGGIYYYTIKTGEFSLSKKMILLK